MALQRSSYLHALIVELYSKTILPQDLGLQIKQHKYR